MFVVRGLHQARRGKLRAPRGSGRTLAFRYDGADGHIRTTTLHLDRTPDGSRGALLMYRLRLDPRKTWTLTVACELRDQHSTALESAPDASAGPSYDQRQRARAGQLDRQAHVETSNALFNAILGRCFMDLHMLRMRERDRVFFAAGVPWYVALFGRDTLITALEVLAFEPDIAANTLRVLASHQGTQIDDERDEQPGKIPHELRVDEMANLGEIPQSAYFGSVDSTPLFLVLLGAHARWTGSLDLFHELHANVRAALDWIDRFADSDGDGFIDYRTRSSRGLRNQGWKDSANAIVLEDGRLAEPPIALPEVQGEVYLAWQCMADLFERDGDAEYALQLRQRADDLRARFNREFWLAEQRYLAFCRQADGRFSASIASNGAHTLWTGIVDARQARDVARRVLQEDVFSGWGVRTLSARDRSYNPIDYQLGSVWPHDNAMIVAGLQQCGFNAAANQVFTAVMQAAAQFPHFRLPEVFGGYPRDLASKPVRYPVACNPQAWAAGSIPHMLASILGVHADGFNGCLRITRPCLPDWLDWVVVKRLRVGGAEIDLRFERSDDATDVTSTCNPSDLPISIEQ
jgi:glycogen debranching enzyme